MWMSILAKKNENTPKRAKKQQPTLGFLRKMFGTRYGPVGPEKFPTKFHRIRGVLSALITFSDSRNPIFNSKDPNRALKHL